MADREDWSAAEGISRTNGVTWDILIASIFHRTEMLTELLEELSWQLIPGVGVHVFRDNLETEYGTKCQRLLDSSAAEYVSFLDDDDWIEPDFVSTIMDALHERPDYVGFKVFWTRDGIPQVPAIHTLQNHGWLDSPDALYRDISHLNPIRRDLALMAPMEGLDGADRRWAERMRDLGCIQTEVFIDRAMYHYRWRPGDTFTVSSIQPPLAESVPQPDCPWVQWVT